MTVLGRVKHLQNVKKKKKKIRSNVKLAVTCLTAIQKIFRVVENKTNEKQFKLKKKKQFFLRIKFYSRAAIR